MLHIWKQGDLPVVGVDEVGRGCLAGPVVAAAVRLKPESKPIFQVDDSKKIRARHREVIAQELLLQVDVGYGEVPANQIDQIGIFAATQLAMDLALRSLPHPIEWVAIDGPWVLSGSFGLAPNQIALVDGDARCYQIAAASILAKVYRDTLMQRRHETFPQYGWSQNKGYGTVNHIQAIQKSGLSPEHRTSFCSHIDILEP